MSDRISVRFDPSLPSYSMNDVVTVLNRSGIDELGFPHPGLSGGEETLELIDTPETRTDCDSLKRERVTNSAADSTRRCLDQPREAFAELHPAMHGGEARTFGRFMLQTRFQFGLVLVGPKQSPRWSCPCQATMWR